MKTTEKTVDVLNDLIQINNDRVAGFEKVLADIDDNNADLKMLFQTYSNQSRENSQELTALVSRIDPDVETGKSVEGGLHRVWIDVKALFGGSDRKSILQEAERGEDAIKKAYKTALSEGDLLIDQEIVQVVNTQAGKINEAHDKIKALRDAA